MKYQIRKSVWESNSSSMHSLVVTKKNSNVRMSQEEIRDEFYLNEEWYKERHKDDEKEVVEIDPWENSFGRSPFTVLSSFRDKLSYAIAEYCGDNYSIKSYVESEKRFNEVFVPLLIKLIGCDEIEYDKTSDNSFDVYADVGGEYLDEVEEVPYEKLVHRDDWKHGEPYYESHDVDGRPIEKVYFDVPDFGSIDHQSSGLLRGFLEDNNLSLEDFLVRKDVVVIIDGDEYCEFDNLIDCGLIGKNSIVLRYPRDMSYDSYIYEENRNEETD